MAKRARKAAEPEDPLCCCEFVNHEGERTHMAACFCDCEHLDQACDRWLKGEAQKEGALSQVVAVVQDRLRVPWLYGARQVDLSVIPPLVLLPVLLRLAALHLFLGVLVMIGLPVLVLWYYYATHRRKGRSLFFLSLALFSLGYMYYLFLTEVVPRGDVGLLQLCTVTIGVVFTLFFLALTKRDPGYLKPHPADTQNSVIDHGGPPELACAPRNGVSPAVQLYARSSESAKSNWCHTCRVVQPPRAGHCRICGFCVRRLDHHCVWINSCVGQANHRCFLLTILLFLLTSVYGISLVLRSVCPKQNTLFALLYCPGVYTQYSTALCFTCSWYCSIVTGGLLHLLVVQFFNVSYNVTEREARLALRQKQGRRHLWGLIVDTGTYSRGFLGNWTEFLTMSSSTDGPSLSLTDLV
ncbi:palmitoyltransferase ZDHHC23-B [Anguilla rostrata]|uniref:palmitoyltransferase ZDHHC23-B n=1 Tax=Anguilla rostrata TaxID=7938 RepID=UPI0030CB15BA